MINDNIVSGKWSEFKGEVQQLWGQVTGDDLDRTKGNVKAIGGLLEQKYGELKEEAIAKFNDLVAKYRGEGTAAETEVRTEGQNKVRDFEAKIADKTEQVKESLQNATSNTGKANEGIRH